MLDPIASSSNQENASKDVLTGQSDGNNFQSRFSLPT